MMFVVVAWNGWPPMAKRALDSSVHTAVRELCAKADALAERGKHREAAGKYVDALELLPKPFTDWEAATWIFGSLGDVHFKAGAFDKALRSFANALYCPGGLANPFIQLRLGQIQLELGSLDAAADHLTRAFMAGGRELFAAEPAKYFAFLETRIDTKPAGRKPANPRRAGRASPQRGRKR